jgi:hypothetical protein
VPFTVPVEQWQSFQSTYFVVEWTGVSTGNKNTILVIVNYVVLGSIENFVIFILLYILE